MIFRKEPGGAHARSQPMDNIIIKGVWPYDICANVYIKAVLNRTGRKQFYASAEAADKALARLRRESRDDIDFPIDPKWKTFAGRETFGGSPLYRFRAGKPGGKAILYLHGGGFVNQPDARHFKMIDRLCAKSGTEIFVPVYPKAPRHTFEETYALVEALYRRLLETRGSEDVIFMGDSAGAMLCVTLCGAFAEKGLPMPKKLILISLAADAALENPEIKRIEPRDPMQGADGLRKYIRAWAGEEPVSSPRINPMAVDFAALPEMILFSGMNEIFCPDVRVFVRRAQEAGANVTCYLFKHMYHCFPVFDLLAAGTVRRLACARIN